MSLPRQPINPGWVRIRSGGGVAFRLYIAFQVQTIQTALLMYVLGDELARFRNSPEKLHIETVQFPFHVLVVL